jgi:2,4-dienoyl-CoA reductase-like NADH-dependent reductase (Old Yellow Enzyme family)
MKLTEPGYIGKLKVRNRAIMAPMISNLANPDGTTNEAHMRYLEERAAGGIGVVITEYTYVDNINSRGSRNQLGIYDTKMIPKLRRLTEGIHRWGAATFVQLVHAGGKASPDINGVESIAPSAMKYFNHMAREMTQEDISRVQESFVTAAKLAQASNFDGVELHGAHGYLIHQFLSPATNKRTDKYGGSFENRLRFVQEIIDGIRSETNFVLGIRLSLFEYDQDGYGPDYGLKIANSLKGIDYVHFSAGRNAPPGSSAPFYYEHNHILKELKGRIEKTSVVVGSVTTVEDAEEVLKTADFVALGRALLADPHFVRKASTAPERIRPCIRCNQACRDLSYGEVRCTVNPDTGFENRVTPKPRLRGEMAIVGGGVKGMEAALTARSYGLKVILYEREDSLGGQLQEVIDPWKKVEFDRLISYYQHMLKRRGVEISLGTEYRGSGVYCLPDEVYPELPQSSEISIDSNVYKYHDLALSLAERGEVIMSNRSLGNLDRGRAEAFRRIAEERGVKFVDNFDFKFSLMVKDQYDIMKAMISGRRTAMEYLQSNIEDYS